MNLNDFVTLLAEHDWTYTYADDYRYFTRGDAQRSVLNDCMRWHPEWKPLFEVFNQFMFQVPPMSQDEFNARKDAELAKLEAKA